VVRRASFTEVPCSVAQALEVVGDWWTLVLVRDLLLDVTRFEPLQQRLGIARNVLADRLDALQRNGIVERVAYQHHPPRHDYVLTEKGRALWPVVAALQAWGDQWAGWQPAPPVEVVHEPCGRATTPVPTCSACRGVLHHDELSQRPRPGAAHVLP
jgi:DNA-binding HxlR family transcriptional regulator